MKFKHIEGTNNWNICFNTKWYRRLNSVLRMRNSWISYFLALNWAFTETIHGNFVDECTYTLSDQMLDILMSQTQCSKNVIIISIKEIKPVSCILLKILYCHFSWNSAKIFKKNTGNENGTVPNIHKLWYICELRKLYILFHILWNDYGIFEKRNFSLNVKWIPPQQAHLKWWHTSHRLLMMYLIFWILQFS